jgi:hypothetical protein
MSNASTAKSGLESLDALFDELDVAARAAESEQQSGAKKRLFEARRKHPRYPFRCSCVVRFFESQHRDVVMLPGRTRNISRSGVGFLVRRLFQVGEVVELELDTRTDECHFLAGEVRFCRYAGRSYYEVGVALRYGGPDPAFSRNPTIAVKVLDWVRDAKLPGGLAYPCP